MTIEIKETKPGHIDITCKDSGRPLVRANQYGMFCDADDCLCEQRSKAIFDNHGINDLIMSMFGR